MTHALVVCFRSNRAFYITYTKFYEKNMYDSTKYTFEKNILFTWTGFGSDHSLSRDPGLSLPHYLHPLLPFFLFLQGSSQWTASTLNLSMGLFLIRGLFFNLCSLALLCTFKVACGPANMSHKHTRSHLKPSTLSWLQTFHPGTPFLLFCWFPWCLV